MMIALKIIQTSSFSTTRSPNPLLHQPAFDARKPCSLPLCRSKPGDSGSEAQGDLQKQELLAKIAMLQAQKLRLTDYLDERSAYLTQFAEDASAEIDAVGEHALKDLDEATSRIMENIDSRMQAFEESSEISKQEIADRDKELADFEGQIEKSRNVGMFFQGLGQRKPVDKDMAKEEAKKITEVTKESAASKTRRNVYLALIGLLSAGIADSFLSSSPDLRKIAVLGAIWVALISQFFYEQKLLSEENQKSGEKENNGGDR